MRRTYQCEGCGAIISHRSRGNEHLKVRPSDGGVNKKIKSCKKGFDNSKI